MREFLCGDDPNAPHNRHLCPSCGKSAGMTWSVYLGGTSHGPCRKCGRDTVSTDDNWSDPTTESQGVTASAYLESQGYTVEPVRGMVEVWLKNMLVLSELTDTELAAFAERVRFEKEGGEG